MSVQASEFEASLANLDFSMVRMKAQKEEGWTREYTEQVEGDYLKFLILNYKYPDRPIVPTKSVDAFWHHHILDTRKYAADCAATFGTMLHHFPYFGLRGGDDAEKLQEAFAETARLAEKEFGATRSPALVGAGCSDCSGNVDARSVPALPVGVGALGTASGCSDCSGSVDRSLRTLNDASGCSDCSGSIDKQPFGAPRVSSVASGCSDCAGNIDDRQFALTH